MAKKITLGRDLSALLGGGQELLEASKDKEENGLKEIAIHRLSKGVYQPRTSMDEKSIAELAESIRSQGIVQPIIVRPKGKDYEIIAGERRFRAAKLAGLEKVPVIIRDVPDEKALALALIENIQRENLNPLEEARAIHRLTEEFSLTHQEVATLLGKNRATISNNVRLLSLHAKVQALLEQNQLEMGHARALLSLEKDKQYPFAQKIIQDHLTVRETEQLVRNASNLKSHNLAKQKLSLPQPMLEIQANLVQKLKRQVKIKPTRNGRGKLTIYYKNIEDLKRIEQLITNLEEENLVE